MILENTKLKVVKKYLKTLQILDAFLYFYRVSQQVLGRNLAKNLVKITKDEKIRQSLFTFLESSTDLTSI